MSKPLAGKRAFEAMGRRSTSLGWPRTSEHYMWGHVWFDYINIRTRWPFQPDEIIEIQICKHCGARK